jgi:hypothetical protein
VTFKPDFPAVSGLIPSHQKMIPFNNGGFFIDTFSTN